MNKEELLTNIKESSNIVETCKSLGIEFTLFEPAWESIPRISPEGENSIEEEEECLEDVWLAFIKLEDDELEFFVEEDATFTYYCEATYEDLKHKVLENITKLNL